jgi:IS1 family transposase
VVGISRPTIIAHLKKAFRIDELWSYVSSKAEEVWVWTALERHSRLLVGLAVGDRSEATCRQLWASLPAGYRKRAICFTGEYVVYANVIPAARHRPSPKGAVRSVTLTVSTLP